MADGWYGFFLLAVAGLLMAVLYGPRDHRMLAMTAIASTVAYFFTPGSAGGPEGNPWQFGIDIRYLFPALAIALLLLAASPRLARGAYRWVARILFLTLLLATEFTSHPFISAWLPGYRKPAIALGVAILLIGAVWRATGWRPKPRTLWIGSGIVVAGAIAAGWPIQEAYVRDRYTQPGVLDAGPVMIRAQTISHARVGVVGFSLPYPLYGRDLSNRVDYVAADGPHGEVTSIPSCSQWRTALTAGAYGYVVTGTNRSGIPELSPEAGWTGTDPSATLIVRDGDVSLFRIDGKLHPESC
jgi:hypothetical protein